MKPLRNNFYLVSILAAVCNSGYGQTSPSGELIMRLVSPFGLHPEKAYVELKDSSSGEVIGRSLHKTQDADSFRMSDLRPGKYLLAIRSPGLETAKELSVIVTTGTTYHSVCLSFVGPFDRFRSVSSVRVSGHVDTSLLAGRRIWVRFQSLYCESKYETEVSKRGDFFLDNVNEGVYAVYMNRYRTDPAMRIVTLRVGQNRVELE